MMPVHTDGAASILPDERGEYCTPGMPMEALAPEPRVQIPAPALASREAWARDFMAPASNPSPIDQGGQPPSQQVRVGD